jgi:hypothetical protein
LDCPQGIVAMWEHDSLYSICALQSIESGGVEHGIRCMCPQGNFFATSTGHGTLEKVESLEQMISYSCMHGFFITETSSLHSASQILAEQDMK